MYALSLGQRQRPDSDSSRFEVTVLFICLRKSKNRGDLDTSSQLTAVSTGTLNVPIELDWNAFCKCVLAAWVMGGRGKVSAGEIVRICSPQCQATNPQSLTVQLVLPIREWTRSVIYVNPLLGTTSPLFPRNYTTGFPLGTTISSTSIANPRVRAEEPLGTRHHGSLEALRHAAARGCGLCVLVEHQVDGLLSELETLGQPRRYYDNVQPQFDL